MTTDSNSYYTTYRRIINNLEDIDSNSRASKKIYESLMESWHGDSEMADILEQNIKHQRGKKETCKDISDKVQKSYRDFEEKEKAKEKDKKGIEKPN